MHTGGTHREIAWRTGGPLGPAIRGRFGCAAILYHRQEVPVSTDTTYTHLRQNLAGILDEVVDQQEVVIVRRKGARDVALLPASELAGIIETAYLLRSPRNARRLLSALRRAEAGKAGPANVRDLRREILGGP